MIYDGTISALNPQNVVPLIEGAGARTIVMVHGWPDTLRVWDGHVEALKDGFRCVRFTLPGFDSKSRSAYSVDALIETLRRVVEQASPGASGMFLCHFLVLLAVRDRSASSFMDPARH